MPPDHNGVATFRIGKRRWASWPLYAGSRAPSQASRSSLLTLTPVRTHTATHVPFCITTLPPRLHRCSTRHQLFLAEISTVAVYFPCAFTTCLRPRGYPRRPGRMEMGLWCLPSLISPPFRVRHLTYATSCRTSGLQSKWVRRLSDRNGTILVAKKCPTPPLHPRLLKNALVLCHVLSAVCLPKAT
jgi:hypothetical protein